MKTEPEHLPALPVGAVYLGKGGEFRTLSDGRVFRGWTLWGSESDWSEWDRLAGDGTDTRYCAPAGSEIVKLNTEVANLTDADKCPKDPPAGWVRVTEGKVRKNDWLHWSVAVCWAHGLIGEHISALTDDTVAYRHPDRLETKPTVDPLPDRFEAEPTVDPLPIVLTPIKRTDEPAAEAYLRWLAGSAYHHSIDDDPCDCPGINPHVAPHLRDRNSEAMIALGYNRAWQIFHP